MDIVYFVREGDDNEELRYSLRSLVNIPHGTVHIVGYKPCWVKNVNYIEVPQSGTKNTNTTNNLKVASESEEISDNFILMNDDFFIMKPIDKIPNLNRGYIVDVAEYYQQFNSPYFKGMVQTHNYILELGYPSPLSYELHVPMVMNKDNVQKMLEQYYFDAPEVGVLHKRSLYGNMFSYGGETIKDVKVYEEDGEFDENSTFLSTQDNIWQNSNVGKFIRSKFTEKSQYEK